MSVYFIGTRGGSVKIGHAGNPLARLRELQCGSPGILELIRVVDGAGRTERWFHRRFSGLRIRGEWFEFSTEMLTIVAPTESSVCQNQVECPGRLSFDDYFYESAARRIINGRKCEALESQRKQVGRRHRYSDDYFFQAILLKRTNESLRKELEPLLRPEP